MNRLYYFPFLLLSEFHLVQNKDLQETPTLGSPKTPRLLISGLTKGGHVYDAHQNHSVFSYQEDSDELYVGGTDFVLKLDVNDFHILEEYPLKTTEQHECHEGSCTNEITVIEKFQDSVFVCGTNGLNPKCWKLFPSVSNQSYEIVESYEGTGFSPFVYTQNSLSLTVDGDLYAAAPLDVEGSSLQFRRKAGSRTNVWMYDSWVSEPTFISASWVKREDDPDNEKIYIFFREKNSDHSPEADPWISRVARVCKVDEGGSKRFFQNTWTSFLKARLVCGFPDESLYFNRLQDIFVMHAEDWHDTKVYALFSSSWNSSAVCVYSIETIETVFENSSFKGYNKEVPHPRPGTETPNAVIHRRKGSPTGIERVSIESKRDCKPVIECTQPICPLTAGGRRFTTQSVMVVETSYDVASAALGCHRSSNHHQCVPNSKSLSWDTVNVVKDYPEMTDWVHSVHYQAPFYTSNHNYTKIAVDRVQAADQHMYNVLLLATDSGKIHKVLEAGSEPFIVSETQLSRTSAVQAMKLDSKKKKLVIGFSEKISSVDLQNCEKYGSSCAECVLARDPYCAWTTSGCTQTVPGSIQNIMNGETSVCSTSTTGDRLKRQISSQTDLGKVHSVPQGVPFYLSCPIDSYHAEYTWEHKGTHSPCLQMLSNCLHLIPSMTPENYGSYNCTSREKNYTKVVKRYDLREPILPQYEEEPMWSRVNSFMNSASGLAQHTMWILLQNIVLWGISR